MECTLRGIFQEHFEAYAKRHRVPAYVHRAAYRIARCRTAQLGGHMRRCPVIAIAHRLSTIARMDRLIVLDAGRIVEEGTHEELLRRRGHYEKLWRHQSGGFLAHDLVAIDTEVELPDEAPVDETRTDTVPEAFSSSTLLQPKGTTLGK